MEIYRNIPKLSTIERMAKALDVEPLTLFRPAGLPQDEHDHLAEERLQRQKKLILAAVEREIDKILYDSDLH